MKIPLSEGKTRLLLGRLSLNMQDSPEVIAEEYRIGQVQIVETGYPEPAVYVKVWAERLTAIRQETKGADEWTAKILEDSELAPEHRIVVYHPPSSAQQFIAAESLLVFNDVTVWFQLEDLTEVCSAGRMKERSLAVVAAYQHLPQGQALTDGYWFYTGYGRVNLKSDDEMVNTSLMAGGLPLTVCTSTIQEQQKETGLVERLTAFANHPELPGKVTKIKAAKRPIAGMAGEEVVFYHQERGKQSIEANFQWGYSGAVQQFPEVQLQWQGELPNPKAMDARLPRWEALLSSMEYKG